MSKERLGPKLIQDVKKEILIKIHRTKELTSMLNPNNQKRVNFIVAHKKAATLRKICLIFRKEKSSNDLNEHYNIRFSISENIPIKVSRSYLQTKFYVVCQSKDYGSEMNFPQG